MAQVQDRKYYTVAEAAQLLAVSRTTVWRWIAEGKLVGYRIGGRTIRIRPEDMQEAMKPARATKNASENDIFRNYDPKRALRALRRCRGMLAGIDRDKLLRDIDDARGQASHGRPE